MKDREFLIWIHQRLINMCRDDPKMKHMHKLRSLISIIPKDFESPKKTTLSIEELKENA